MKRLTQKIVTVATLLLAAMPLSAQTEQTYELSSENNNYVWNRSTTDGRLSLSAKVGDTDTTFTLGLEVRDTRKLMPMKCGDRIVLTFANADTLSLECGADANIYEGRENYSFFYMFILFGTSGKSFKSIKPSFAVSREQLLRIIDGKVSRVTLCTDNQRYDIKIKGNRFSEDTGELCASLRETKTNVVKAGDQLQELDDIDPKLLFDNARLRRPAFHWNRHLGISLGWNHFYGHFGARGLETISPRNNVSMDMLLKGFYMGASYGSSEGNYDYENSYFDNQHYGHYVYYDDLRISTGTVKFGPAFQYGTERSWLTIVPYVGLMYLEVQRGTKYDKAYDSGKTLFGLRLSYNIRHFMIGANASNHEAGLFVGYSF